MHWAVGLLLVALLGRALAQESPSAPVDLTGEDAARAYDEVIVRFNTNTQEFSSWEAFKTAVFSKVLPGTLGRCYESTGSAMQPVHVTMVSFPRETDGDWQKTSGNGWRREKADRTFIEYRVNKKAGVLLWIEGAKPKFFFAQTRKICEFPL